MPLEDRGGNVLGWPRCGGEALSRVVWFRAFGDLAGLLCSVVSTATLEVGGSGWVEYSRVTVRELKHERVALEGRRC